MEVQDRLMRLRQQTFQAIADAAKAGLTEKVNRLGGIARDCDVAIVSFDNLKAEMIRLSTALQQTINETSSKDDSSDTPLPLKATIQDAADGLSPRAKAKAVRVRWISRIRQQANIQLLQIAEVKFRTPSGKSVGIPYASERDALPDKWFLGLPDEHFDIVALLCSTGSGELLDFVLPSELVRNIWGRLSRDTRKHVKFHVLRTGVNYELQLSGGAPIFVNEFRGQLGPLV